MKIDINSFLHGRVVFLLLFIHATFQTGIHEKATAENCRPFFIKVAASCLIIWYKTHCRSPRPRIAFIEGMIIDEEKTDHRIGPW
jgi:hypothetical protein